MSFARETIEDALRKLSAGGEASQRANELLMKWIDTPSGIVQAIQIISQSTDNGLIFQAANVTQTFIDQKWMNYPVSDHRYVRDTLCEKLVNFNGPAFIRAKLIALVVSVAMKDWPEEWPECLDNFINSTQNSPEMCVLDFEVIATLIHAIHESDTITSFRRKKMIDLVNNSTKLLLDCIEWALTLDQSIVGESLCRLIEVLCLTAPPDLLLRPGMLEYIITQLVRNETTSVSATGALTNLFVRRPDARDFAPGLLEEVLQLLARIVSEEIPEHFLVFIMQFFREYGSDIEEMCFHDDEPDEEVMGWVVAVYRLILQKAASPDEYSEDFWLLWRNVLVRYARIVKSSNRFDQLLPCFRLFRELIPEIRESLYISLASAAECGKLRSLDCQTCWICLATADKEGMVEFVKSMLGNPTPSLCFAVGLLDCCLNGQEEYSLLSAILPALLNYNQAMIGKKTLNVNPFEFGTALLYALSHSVRFLGRRKEILGAFGQCLIAFLNHPEPVVFNAAANALFYISNRQPSLLFRREAPICDALLENINELVASRPAKVTSKIVKALALMASEAKNPEDKGRFYEAAFGPVLGLLSSGNDESIESGIGIIRDLSKMKLEGSEPVFFNALEALYPVFERTVQAGNEVLITILTETITDVIYVFRFEDVKAVIEGFTAQLLQLPFRDIALMTFCRLRRKFVQMDVLYEKIYTSQIEPILPTLRETQFEALGVLSFFRMYRKEPAVLHVVSEVAIHFVKDERLDVSKESAKLLHSLFNYLYDQHQFTDIVNGRVVILTALFDALTDNLHRPILRALAKALDGFFLCIANSTLPTSKLDEDVVNVLLAKTPNKEMLTNFAGFLRGSYSDFPKFFDALHEFLVALKCASISDRHLFKREIEMDAMEQLLSSFVAGEEKNAIKAEGAEALSDMKQLAAALAALH